MSEKGNKNKTKEEGEREAAKRGKTTTRYLLFFSHISLKP